MSNIQDYVKDANKWINRLRIKTKHRWMMNDTLSYSDYKEYLFFVINQIRKALKFDVLSRAKFDEAWQYRVMAHENWDIARDHIVNTILGWW